MGGWTRIRGLEPLFVSHRVKFRGLDPSREPIASLPALFRTVHPLGPSFSLFLFSLTTTLIIHRYTLLSLLLYPHPSRRWPPQCTRSNPQTSCTCHPSHLSSRIRAPYIQAKPSPSRHTPSQSTATSARVKHPKMTTHIAIRTDGLCPFFYVSKRRIRACVPRSFTAAYQRHHSACSQAYGRCR